MLGEQTAVTDPHGNTQTTTWNMLGEKTADNDPDSGLTTYQYDPAGNLTRTQDARGRVTTMAYDALNRLRASTDHTTGQRKTWTYGTGGDADTGQLTAESDPSAARCPGQTSHQWRYNLLGAVTQQTQCTGGLTATITTRYDALGEPDATTYPDNLVVRQTYDAAGQLTAIPGYVQNIAYNAAGQPTAITYANHTTATDTYDPARGWLTAQDLTSNSSHATLFAEAYTYDLAGLMAATGNAGNSQELAYTYNTLGELTGVTDAATGHNMQSLQYDDLGNIASNSSVGTYTYPASRQCTTTSCPGPQAVTAAGPHSYTYDADGDTTSDTTAGNTTRYTWTTDGMLATATSPDYGTITSTYDADHHLVQQADQAGTTVYAGGLATHTKAGWTDYIYADGTLVADHTTPRDALVRPGLPRLNTRYHRPGRAPHHRSQLHRLRSTTNRHNTATRLHQRPARRHQPTARPTSPRLQPCHRANAQRDTITTADTAIGLNRYAYAYDNPIQYTDPTGHDPISIDPTQPPSWSTLVPDGGFDPFTGLASAKLLLSLDSIHSDEEWTAYWQQQQATASNTPTAGQASQAANGQTPGPNEAGTGGSGAAGTLGIGTDVSPVTPVGLNPAAPQCLQMRLTRTKKHLRRVQSLPRLFGTERLSSGSSSKRYHASGSPNGCQTWSWYRCF